MVGSLQLLALVSLVTADGSEAFPIQAVEARLREQAHGAVPAVAIVQSCSFASETPQLKASDFPSLYPRGLYVLCGTKVTGSTAQATLLRYLFNSAQSRVLAASRIEATLLLHAGEWRIHTWRQSFVDYAL